MFLKYLKVKNIRTFSNAEIEFDKTNFITGMNLDTNDGNGLGKSSLVFSILTLIGGSSLTSINLSKLIRHNQKEAKIEGIIELNSGEVLEIKRTLKKRGSGSLAVKVNGKNLNCSTSTQYQEEIFSYLENADNFKKFRIIDKDSGINILDFTSGQLRKTLMGMCQDKFDAIRSKLLSRKNEFEKFSISHLLSAHAPSKKRLKILEGAILSLDNEKLRELNSKINEYNRDRNSIATQRGKYEQIIKIKNSQSYKLKSLSTCPTCFQKVNDSHKNSICSQLNKEIKKVQSQLKEILSKLEIYNDLLLSEEKKKSKIYKEKDKLTSLKYKLETRLKQENYKYTLKDIELAKKAIEEVDRFANYYIIEWVNIIEPIVNSYLEVLGIKFSFNVNEKGNLNPKIDRENETLDYDQLSQGEKIFISVIFKIALLLENNETGLLIADEGFDALSTENLDRIVNLVSNLPIQLIAVTHNKNVDTSRAKIIYIEKEKGESKIK